MRWTRWAVVAVAVGIAAATFLKLPRSRYRVSYATLTIPREAVQADLDRIEAEALAAGFERLERHGLPGVYGGHVSIDNSIGRCLLLVGGTWHHQRIEAFRDGRGDRVSVDADSEVGFRQTRLTDFRRVCWGDPRVIGEPTLELEMTRRHRGAGGGEILAFEGAPSLALPTRGAVVSSIVAQSSAEDVTMAAAQKAVMVLLVLLLIGLMVEGAVHRRADPPVDAVSVRTLSIALPSERRAELQPLVDAVREGDVRAVYTLRQVLSARASLAPRFDARHKRDRLGVIDPLVDDVCRAFGELADPANTGGYRGRTAGLCVVTLVLVHKCELPDLPVRRSAKALETALSFSLPADEAELIAAEAFLHPRDPSVTLEEEAIESVFAAADEGGLPAVELPPDEPMEPVLGGESDHSPSVR